MAKEWSDLFSEIDTYIKTGQFDHAESSIKKIRMSHLPRNHVVEYCALARRLNLWQLSVQVLKPFVRPKVKTQAARPLEIIEYAMALRRAGAISEANDLLSAPDLNGQPKAYLARAFGSIYDWNYDTALSHLDKYLEFKDITPYERDVAQVNRLACLYFTDQNAFVKLFAKLENELARDKRPLLLANILEIYSQFLMDNEQWTEATEILKRSKSTVGNTESSSTIYADKWLEIIAALKSKSEPEITKLRKRALKIEDWETMRSLDYHLTKLNPKNRWAEVVYYGTPFQNFRRRLENFRAYSDESYLGTPAATVKFDPYFPGKDENDSPHRFVVYLLKDLYRPAHIGEIYTTFFPGKFFDIEGSEQRVRQLVHRTKEWLSEIGAPLEIRYLANQYCLRLKPQGSILMRKNHISLDRTKFIFERFYQDAGKPLSSEQWAERLKSPMSTTLRLLAQGRTSGVLEKEGSSRYTTYTLVKS